MKSTHSIMHKSVFWIIRISICQRPSRRKIIWAPSPSTLSNHIHTIPTTQHSLYYNISFSIYSLFHETLPPYLTFGPVIRNKCVMQYSLSRMANHPAGRPAAHGYPPTNANGKHTHTATHKVCPTKPTEYPITCVHYQNHIWQPALSSILFHLAAIWRTRNAEATRQPRSSVLLQHINSRNRNQLKEPFLYPVSRYTYTHYVTGLHVPRTYFTPTTKHLTQLHQPQHTYRHHKSHQENEKSAYTYYSPLLLCKHTRPGLARLTITKQNQALMRLTRSFRK